MAKWSWHSSLGVFIACLAVSDPGVVFDETRPNVNDWEPWYLGLDPDQKRLRAGVPATDNPRTGAYRKMVETGRDLHELHPLIAPRPFLVSGGSEDLPARWVALNHARAVTNDRFTLLCGLCDFTGADLRRTRIDHGGRRS